MNHEYVVTFHEPFGRDVHNMLGTLDSANWQLENLRNAASAFTRTRFTVTNEDTGEVIASRVAAAQLPVIVERGEGKPVDIFMDTS